MSPCDVLVLDGATRASLVVARSLGRAGLRVAAAESCRPRHAPAAWSKHCTAAFELPSHAVGPRAYVSAVLDVVARTGAQLVVPVHDASVAALRSERPDVEAAAAVALPSAEPLSVFLDKERTVRLADTLGVRTPRSSRVTRMADVEAAERDIGLPAVVKPVESWVVDVRQRATRVDSADVVTSAEMEGAVARLLAAGGTALVQELLPGLREAVHAFAVDGRVVLAASQATIRTWPPLGGTSVLRLATPLAENLLSAAEALLRATDYAGYAEVEFRRAADGTPALMEVNPRLSASVEVPVRAGADFPLLIWQHHRGMPLTIGAVRDDVRMRWLGGDLRWVLRVVTERGRPDRPEPLDAVRSFIAEFARGDGLDYLGWGDPLPALAAVAGVGRSAWRHARRDGPTPG